MRSLLRGLTLVAWFGALTAPAEAQSGFGQMAGGQQTPGQQTGDQGQPQQRPPRQRRPFDGLFGNPTRDDGMGQTLTVTMQGYGGYDDNVVADQVAGNDPRSAVGSSIVGGGATLAYAKIGRRVNFSSTVNGDTRYYPDRSSLSGGSYGGGAGLTYQFSRRSRLTLNGNAAYQPFYQFGLFPALTDPILGGGISSDLDFSVARRASWQTNGNVSFERDLSQRSTLTLQYIYNGQFFTDAPITTPPETTPPGAPPVARTDQFGDYNSHAVGIRFRRSLTRDLGVRIGYEYRRARFPAALTSSTLNSYNIDAGVDYGRSLAFSRKTRVAFATGSSIVRMPGQSTRYWFTGNANLSHQFSRDWQASVAYLRDVGLFGNLNTPVFSDAVNAQLRGVLADRLLVTVSGGYLSGQLGLANSGSFSTATGSASAVYAITQVLGINVTYAYFQYDFDEAVQLPDGTGLRPRFDRNSIRAGLTLWLPLLR